VSPTSAGCSSHSSSIGPPPAPPPPRATAGTSGFTRPAGLDLVGRTLAPGVALIARGYALAPSSTVAGRPYRFELDVEPIELPAPLAKLCQQRAFSARPGPPQGDATPDRAALRALELDPQRIALADEGERNVTLNRVAYWLGGFVGAGRLPRADVEAALTAAALTAGLEPDEIEATIASGLTAGETAPLHRVPLTEALPRAPVT
jgi:hypothetical protein